MFNKHIQFSLLYLLVCSPFMPLLGAEDAAQELAESPEESGTGPLITAIRIPDNTLLPATALRAKIPYRENEPFDPTLTRRLINNLLSLGYFSFVDVSTKEIDPDHVELIITVEEKPKIESITYEGNAHLKQDEIEKKLKLSEIPAMDTYDADYYARKIQTLYGEKSYHNATVTGTLETTGPHNARLVFSITEGTPSVVKRVVFKGNRAFSAKKLRTIILHREDWILGFLDRGGAFQPEMLEGDKFMLENFYQSNGYLAAQVTGMAVERDPNNPCIITLVYTIDEGDVYTITQVQAPGNDLVSEPALLAGIPVRAGQLYSKELIRKSLEIIRTVWGQFGYIYADVTPAIVPDPEHKTVTITFNSELGAPVSLNRLTITGNKKTRDYVIRRLINLNEGDVITTAAMDEAKDSIEQLGYFEPREGVNWKINRINDNLADLDLLLKEVPTGNIFAQIGYGGRESDPKSPDTSWRISTGIGDRNFLGTGLRYNVALNYSADDRSAVLSLAKPWLFERPIEGRLDFYHRKTTYDEFRNINQIPRERVTGFSGVLGFFNVGGYRNTTGTLNIGLEQLRYPKELVNKEEKPFSVPESSGIEPAVAAQLSQYYQRQFSPGLYNWLGLSLVRDLRNNPVSPNRGYLFDITSKIGVPAGSPYGFAKVESDFTWVAPLIGDYDLLFYLHGHGGIIKNLDDRIIPYRELFHLGGPATVRGFTYGQIGPMIFGDSLGGRKAFWVNAELIFTIAKDLGFKGVLFYDGGAAWDAQVHKEPLCKEIINNRFHYRHAIGFGIRVNYQGTPIKVDWGFKLDRNKRRGESASEVHFSMSQDF